MPRPSRRRRFTPAPTVLEPRRLLALSAAWLGQDGGDHVGTEGTLIDQSPNDYQDVHLRLAGLTAAANVTRVDVERFGGGGWSWSPSGGKNAMFLPDPSDPAAGDLFLEPYHADPAGTLYQAIRVTFADGTIDQTSLLSGSAVDPNLRVPNSGVRATFAGQDGQDWTGATIAVGPDGFQDVHVTLANLSAGASARVRITAATNPPLSWETGINPDGRLNAELLNRPGANDPLGTTADVYFSSNANLAGATLTVEILYDHWNPDYRSYTNRSGKTDSTVIIASATDPSLAMPRIAEVDMAGFLAGSLPQDAGFPGLSHVGIDAASLAALASPQSFATIRSAVLSNRHGAIWNFQKGEGSGDPTRMSLSPSTGILDFRPVRNEEGSALALRLTFDDGAEAVARFDGAEADLDRLAVDPRHGATTRLATNAAELLAALADHAPSIRLVAGAYSLDRPLSLDSPVRITAEPGVVLNFVLSATPNSPWNGSTGAILVRSSHVALDGFAMRFVGTTADWNAPSRQIVQAGLGTIDVDLAFTNLDVIAPAAATPGVREVAVPLMNFDDGDTGVIVGNALTGGWIQLGAAPWRVEGNDYRGAVADTITPSFLAVRRSFDLDIVGNHAHQLDPRGIAQRFIVMGNADSGQGIGNVIAGNAIDGGIGTPTSNVPAGWDNNPEIILTETYQPRFEGVPSSVSPDGFILQIPQLRGPSARTGDVVSILTEPHAGEWRMIAQALGPTRYLLDSPLPSGDFAIAIGRGYVDQAYVDNTIDLRGMIANNVAVVISGNHWGQRIEGNTFLGGEALRVGAGSNEGAFEGLHPAPWGWSRLPVLGIVINDNTFVDSSVDLRVARGWADKSSAGRTYLQGAFSHNAIEWNDPNRPAVVFGGGDGPPPAWLGPERIVLEAIGNVVIGGTPRVRAEAAMINGVPFGVDAWTLPAAIPSPGPGQAPPNGGARGGSMAFAFDDDESTVWIGDSHSGWLQFASPAGLPMTIDGYSITNSADADQHPRRIPQSWILQGSDDGSTWTTLDVHDGGGLAPVGSATLAIHLAAPVSHRFYRLESIASAGDPFVQIADVRFGSGGLPPGNGGPIAQVSGIGLPSESTGGGNEAPGSSSMAMAIDAPTGRATRNEPTVWFVDDPGMLRDIDRFRVAREAALAAIHDLQNGDDDPFPTSLRSLAAADETAPPRTRHRLASKRPGGAVDLVARRDGR